MFENGIIIKTKKLSPREVKKKLHDFIDSISEDCGPDAEQMADELKEHGDAFIDALGGGGYQRNGSGYGRNDGGYYRQDGVGMSRGYNRTHGAMYRNEGMPDEQRRHNEQKLQEMERQMQELRQQMMSGV